MKLFKLLVMALIAAPLSASAQDITYQRPPQVIEDIVMASTSPAVHFSRHFDRMLELERAPYITVAELAQPELRLAGIRFEPNTYYTSRQRGYTRIFITDMKDKSRRQVTGLPADGIIVDTFENPAGDGCLIAVKGDDGVYLYRADYKDGTATQVSRRRLNAVNGITVVWLSDTDFLTLMVPTSNRQAPAENRTPRGPIVQENIGKTTPARTYQDMLKNPYDESLFEYYFTSQLVKVTPQDETEINAPAIYAGISASPDRSLLLVRTIEKPYSYVVPMQNFPTHIVVTDTNGKLVKDILQTPVLITAMGYDTTSPYPRSHAWRADKPATLFWVEAQDDGNPRSKQVDYADIVYQQEAPFTGDKQEVARTRHRYGGITWCDDSFALLREQSRETRRRQTFSFKPASGEAPTLVFDVSTDDLYNDPGTPHLVRNQYDRYVLYTNKAHSELLMLSEGASPEGDMPYLSRYDLKTKKNTILWRCRAPYYEEVIDIINPAKLEVITSRQSKELPANYFLKNLKSGRETALTAFPNPYPMLEGVSRELIRYKRADGIDLTATVYLPKGYDKARDGRLPVLMWAYPREYRSAADAAQVRGSKYTFTTINYGSPVYWVTQGFCVMENVEMPIVGSDGREPNDTFVEQLQMNAEAAVKVITDMGVGDPDRIAVGGHSYGAFMTANLMTHTNLFKAGIARSGAYNRTLTPFGFQAETRTYWEAPEVYNTMSPFMYADKLSGALLLVHGELDNNTGTFPLQSERFYQALKGNKGTVRYVVLPLESHGYAAKENILHLLYESDRWLKTYLK
ncbi:MAG: prolyl oligopeptidase family serine peptidase [Prevotellaceae bacterium]|jgi:dipeptidyl aminopeptidase/acylaminoacyl peptidase|nr:prolyl oligopeptidase family serine peptidase [Prevotellaceae bacterium]